MTVIDFSLEVFPPKTNGAYHDLMSVVGDLAELNPRFMTVTYGAGGSTKDKTKDIVIDIASQNNFPVAAHLTCVGASRAEIDAIADEYWEAGIKHIIALRGDPPEGVGEDYTPHPDGYAYAVDLVEGLRKRHDFEISVAAYAEGHPQAPSLDFDLNYLKRKLDAGATRAITQFFFDPELFLRFRDRAIKKGITQPIIPGIMPILDFKKMTNFAQRCGAPVPNFLHKMFEGFEPDSLDHKLLAMNVLSHQITRLIEEGVTLFHFYTMNDTLLTKHLCHWLRVGF